ncbi:hypothetical protein UVI_02059820 [Ustilaginoidea virens]|uniref:Small ribosomal subunit protein mS35 mitochondrial conserved domain-containing protein n=1 Tax=Ustilaginoidea virens TaxID=1159556 RepID=A0A1B5L3P5_USTVR|nr:hypothetical protein UVI_02059820 [Ustilaginoidea virens]
MSCESYEHQAQNRQHLLALVNDLVAAAKDPEDTFEDVPLDLRHRRVKAKPRFPREWRMTDQRRLELEEQRRQQAIGDLERAEKGLLVDGQKAIDGYLMQRVIEEQEQQARAAEMATAAKTRARRSPGSLCTIYPRDRGAGVGGGTQWLRILPESSIECIATLLKRVRCAAE